MRNIDDPRLHVRTEVDRANLFTFYDKIYENSNYVQSFIDCLRENPREMVRKLVMEADLDVLMTMPSSWCREARERCAVELAFKKYNIKPDGNLQDGNEPTLELKGAINGHAQLLLACIDSDYDPRRTCVLDVFAQCAEDNAMGRFTRFLDNEGSRIEEFSISWTATRRDNDNQGNQVNFDLCPVCRFRFPERLNEVLKKKGFEWQGNYRFKKKGSLHAAAHVDGDGSLK